MTHYTSQSSIAVIPKVSLEVAAEFQENIRIWTTSKNALMREKGKEYVFKFLRNQLQFNLKYQYKSISFITIGIAYGIFPFNCPTTHYFLFNLGLDILRGWLKTNQSFLHTPMAFLCDPGEFESNEISSLRTWFFSKRYIVRISQGPNATVRNTKYISQYIPMDFLFYSSHCGEVQGQRVKDTFYTSDGEKHHIVYDLAPSFSFKPGSDEVEVLEFKRWISLDGIDWDDKEQKKANNIGNIFKEYIHLSIEKKITSSETLSEVEIVKGANALKMHDHNFFPAIRMVGANKYPFVFNNACSSWNEMSKLFSVAGASIYIGTAIDVPNIMAVEVAKEFAKFISNGRAAGFALFNAQKNLIIDLNYTPYLMNGYLFTKWKVPHKRGLNKIIYLKQLAVEIKRWNLYRKETEDEKLKKNADEIISFLKDEIKKYGTWVSQRMSIN